ncbi:amino acid ABC transporter permease [Cognatishimia maritima]|nr:ABC transporter permease subunit [Cognatishimia maritima]
MFWNDAKIRGLIYQATVLVLVLLALAYFALNAQQALQERGITTGLAFLGQQSGFAIGEGAITHDASDTYFHALLTGAINTLTVSIASIVGATMIGLLLGIARLSANKLLSGFALIYVELFRNTPQLLQMVMWYLLLTQLPGPRDALSPIAGHLYLTNRGINIPVLENGTSLFTAFLLALVLVVICVTTAFRLMDRRLRNTGKANGRFAALAGAGIAALLGTWLLLGTPTTLVSPTLQGFKYRGGQTISPEFIALFFGLSLYIGAFIGEIVRAGLQSVSRGQLEAADSIPLSRYDRFRLIVLPQALRVMVPPATAQYVSLLKNSALGVAVGYPELFNVTNTTTTLSGQALECVLLMAVFYLSIALTISALMNLYNRRVQIKER